MRRLAVRASALFVVATVLAACDLGTPTFVRFDRGERVSAELSRSQKDRCVIVILMSQRSYVAQLDQCETREEKR